MSPPPNEPSLMQVMYDSLLEIKQSVQGVSEKQTQLAVSVATAIAKSDETSRSYLQLQKQVDDLEGTVSDLKRTAWLLTVIGGIVVAVVTSVASDFVSSRLTGPDKPAAPAAQLTARE